MELRKEPMSYSRASELIKRELQKEELDPKLYGVHSLRAEGASAAAALGVPDRLFQRQGNGVVRGLKTITFRSPWSHC